MVVKVLYMRMYDKGRMGLADSKERQMPQDECNGMQTIDRKVFHKRPKYARRVRGWGIGRSGGRAGKQARSA